MRPPELITANTFKTQTTLPKRKGRKHLQPIDALLEEWTNRLPSTVEQRIELLVHIITQCQVWLMHRERKTTNNTVLRKPAVEELQRLALLRRQYEELTRADYLRFHGKKAQARQFAGQSLQAGYSVERTQFVQQKTAMRANNTWNASSTISPIGGSHVHEVHTSRHVQPRPGAFANLTPDDFQHYASPNFDNYSTQSKYVHYMRKDERITNNMVTIQNGLLMHRGQLYTTQHNRIYIYAMDVYGNLFVQLSNAYGRAVDEYYEAQFNHSSLNAGKDVICAGVIAVTNGVLAQIDNASGHYRPNTANLLECVQELVNDGLNVGTATVTDFSVGLNPVQETVTAFLARLSPQPGAVPVAPPAQNAGWTATNAAPTPRGRVRLGIGRP